MSALHPLQMFAVRNVPADAILMTGGTLFIAERDDMREVIPPRFVN
jgi:hypothetical protein